MTIEQHGLQSRNRRAFNIFAWRIANVPGLVRLDVVSLKRDLKDCRIGLRRTNLRGNVNRIEELIQFADSQQIHQPRVEIGDDAKPKAAPFEFL